MEWVFDDEIPATSTIEKNSNHCQNPVRVPKKKALEWAFFRQIGIEAAALKPHADTIFQYRG